MLEPTSVHAAVGQSVTRTVSEHVSMNWNWYSRGFSRPLDHTRNAHALERLPALIHKYVGARLSCNDLLALQALQTCQLVSLQVVAAVN